MCGGFYCSRNSLLLLNIVYIVSFPDFSFKNRFSTNSAICIAKSISHVTNALFLYLGCWGTSNKLRRVWKSLHRPPNSSVTNWLRNCSHLASFVWIVWGGKAPSSHFVLLHDHPLLPLHCSICRCLLLLGC